MGKMRIKYKVTVEKPKGRGHLIDLGVDGRIILKRILNIRI
jgi:hypothetical protein